MKKFLFLLISSFFLVACTIPPTLNQNQIQQQTRQSDDTQVPPPSGMDIINLFWQLINEGRIPEAIDMISPTLIPDESAKQAYGVQFNHIKSVNVIDIVPFDPDNWTDNSQLYQVTLEIYVSSDAANAPIPYYGYVDNPNTRFISLTKNQADIWQIASIATGP